jgi:acyl-coenzyme A thioesterase PaaI-like protein
LADNALSFCGGSTLGASLRSSGFTIEMLPPARTGPLRAEATTVVSTRRHAVCRCEITGPEGTYAVAQGRVTAVA